MEEMVVNLKGNATITLSNDKGEKVVMNYDAKAETFSMDRDSADGGETYGSYLVLGCQTVVSDAGTRQYLLLFRYIASLCR